MKHLVKLTLVLLMVSCQTSTPPPAAISSEDDAPLGINEKDFTGVKKYYSSGKLIKEVTFEKGIRNGLCKNYYKDGRLKSTIIYRNELKVDTARWYYPEGMLYRSTPYSNDKINGLQVKYYKSGKIQASLPYKDSKRMPGLKEYYENGDPVKGYPEITYVLRDHYSEEGRVLIELKLSNGSANTDFYTGSLVDGAFDPDRCQKLATSSGSALIQLKKDASNGKGYIDVIGVFATRFRNSEILTKRIKLPYSDLS